MDPEQGLLVIHEDFAVKFFVLFLGTLVGMLGPQRMGIADGNRTFVDLYLIFGRGNNNGLFLTLVIFFLFGLCILVDVLNYHIVVAKLALVDGFVLLGSVGLAQENLGRHEGTVFLQYLADAVLIGELHALLIQKKGDLCSNGCLLTVADGILGTAVALPVNGFCSFFIGKGIDVNVVGYHKCRIEAQSEMADDLIVVCFVFVFLQKVGSAGESDLGDVFFYLILVHAETVINEFQGLGIRIADDFDFCLVIVREGVLAHGFQLFQFGDGVAAVGNQLTDKDIMVGIEPFFYDRENIFTVNG